jgi:small subunit ribosomal protein S20
VVDKRELPIIFAGWFVVGFLKGNALPNHKSCAKRMKTSEESRLRNRAFRSQLRQAIKEIRSETGREEAARKLKIAIPLIDRAAGKGLIHKRNAARNKSRLSHFVSKLG